MLSNAKNDKIRFSRVKTITFLAMLKFFHVDSLLYVYAYMWQSK